jgi:hypothetical protein
LLRLLLFFGMPLSDVFYVFSCLYPLHCLRFHTRKRFLDDGGCCRVVLTFQERRQKSNKKYGGGGDSPRTACHPVLGFSNTSTRKTSLGFVSLWLTDSSGRSFSLLHPYAYEPKQIDGQSWAHARSRDEVRARSCKKKTTRRLFYNWSLIALTCPSTWTIAGGRNRARFERWGQIHIGAGFATRVVVCVVVIPEDKWDAWKVCGRCLFRTILSSTVRHKAVQTVTIVFSLALQPSSRGAKK